jgi:hypothetical protein
MIIDSPIWHMKITCPCCEQGNPIFVVCPNCGFLTVQCDEMLDFFADPKNLDKGFIKECPKCNMDTDNFKEATWEQIVAAGFTKDDYE